MDEPKSKESIQQELVENALAAVTRAMGKQSELSVHFTTSNAYGLKKNAKSLSLTLPPFYLQQAERVRGQVDAVALRLRYHDAAAHNRVRPQKSGPAEIFDAAEEARYLANGIEQFSGTKTHIESYLHQHYKNGDVFALKEGQDIPLAEVLKLVLLKEFVDIKIPSAAKEAWRKFSPLLTVKLKDILPDLQKNIAAQNNYAREVYRLIQKFQLDESKEQQEQSEKENAESGSEHQGQQDENGQQQEGMEEEMQTVSSPGESDGERVGEMRESAMMEGDDESSENEEGEAYLRPNDDAQNAMADYSRYQVYTRRFDEIVPATALATEKELSQLRHQLDQKLEAIQKATRRHANTFLRKLLALQRRRWQFNLEEGILDSSRLAQAIADPSYSYYYKREVDVEDKNTYVTLLIDNSGSMRGRPITVAAMSADILAKTLEDCGIRVEVLGFTSREWKGGKSRRAWQENHCPLNPGRLNDLRHIIYKSAETPWRRARKNMGLMLKEGILKENIDGEAILWACSRMASRPEQRRILMVISDGAPVDDSTLSTNGQDYLDRHLREVIHFVEERSSIELMAIGIGHDVTRYYKRAVTIRDVDELGSTMFSQLSDVVAGSEV